MTNALKSKTLIDSDQNKGVIYQVSLLQGLTYGDYFGSVKIAELKQHGDIGIGTFDKLNGELIMLDGEVFRVSGDGTVSAVYNDETTPFSVVTFFKTHESINLNDVINFETLHQQLDELVCKRGKNRFYMIRIDGMFNEINVRSVYQQQKPYKPLVKVLQNDQTFFDYQNIDGTVVGLYCPPYMSSLNAVGWHMHFISKDKTKGGHVLGLNIASAMLSLDYIDEFQLKLAQSEMFANFDLTVDQSEDIKKVETNK